MRSAPAAPPSKLASAARLAFGLLAIVSVALSAWLLGAVARELAPAGVAGFGASFAAALVVALVVPLAFEHRVTAAFRKRDPEAAHVRVSALFAWNALVLVALLLAVGTTSKRALHDHGAWPLPGGDGGDPALGRAGRWLALELGHRPLGEGCELEAPPTTGSIAAPATDATSAPSAAASSLASASAAPSASVAASASASAPPPPAPPPVVSDRDLAPDELFAQRGDTVAMIRVRRALGPDSMEAKLLGIDELAGHGSGFAVDGEGRFVTNAHVVEGATSALVRLRDGRAFDRVTVLAVDKARDLALLSIDVRGNAYAPLGEGPVKTGARALAIGNPLGLEHSLTDGIVSAERVRGGTRMLQIQTTIAPGSSGGPLFDVRGRVIGVTTATEGAGLNLAVHVDQVRALLAVPREPKPLEAWREPGVVEELRFEGVELLPTARANLEEGAATLAQLAGSCLRKQGPPTGSLRWRIERASDPGERDVLEVLRARPSVELEGPSKACLERLAGLVATQLGLALYQSVPDAHRGEATMSFRIVAPAAAGSETPGRALDVRFVVETR